MNNTLDKLLNEWNDPLGSRTMSDAEDLIHMLLVDLAGKDAVIEELTKDVQFYKKRYAQSAVSSLFRCRKNQP